MIPQKFIMMKCVRVVVLLHVFGIVFFAFKLYSSSQTGLSEMSSRDVVVPWSVAGNFSRKTYSREDNFGDNANVIQNNDNNVENDEEINVVPSDETDTETLDEDENIEEEFDTIIKLDNDISSDKKKIDNDQNSYDDYKAEYIDKIKDKQKAGISVSSSRNTKTEAESLTFKQQQSQSLSFPSSVLMRNNHWTITYAGKYSKSIYSPPPNERAIQRLPQAIVIGSPNSGIRPLLDFLEIHPQIVPLKKEVPFFDQRNKFQFFTSTFLSQMPLSYSNQVTVGRTHFAHWTKKTVCDFYQGIKFLKVIVVLRDPVSRILSQASSSGIGRTRQLVVAQHGETLKVNNDTQTVEWGRYVEYLKMWAQCFPKTQLHIVEWRDLMQRPAQIVHGIETFLSVSSRIREENFRRDAERRVYCIRPFHLNETVCLSEKTAISPSLSPEEEAMIYQFYSKHNEELFRLLGQRYPWGPDGADERALNF